MRFCDDQLVDVPPTDPSWREYDQVCLHYAKRGVIPNHGDPLPALISNRCGQLINADIDAFVERIRSMMYALAMGETL